MVKMTVLYTLADDMDYDAFIEWRKVEGEAENTADPGVIKTDCYTIKRIIDNDLNEAEVEYQFITEIYYETMQDLENAFFNEKTFESLRNTPWKTSKRIFTIAEPLTETIVIEK